MLHWIQIQILIQTQIHKNEISNTNNSKYENTNTCNYSVSNAMIYMPIQKLVPIQFQIQMLIQVMPQLMVATSHLGKRGSFQKDSHNFALNIVGIRK